MTPLRILIADDSESDAKLIVRALRSLDRLIETERVQDAPTMRAALATREWDAIISDWSMPQFTALDALALAQERQLDVPFIIVSGTIGEEAAVEAMRAGAHDYVAKDRLARLAPSLERELRDGEGRRAQRRAEEALRRSEERYRMLFDRSPLPTWTYDRETLAFVSVNEAAIAHYGYTRGEFAAMTLEDIRPPEDLPALHDDVRAGVPTPKTWRHKRKDGALITVEIRAHDFTSGGRPTRLAVVNDVTERERAQDALRKTEEQLRQLQKMEAVSRLAGGVAHDFNNVLSVILSYAELILADVEPGGRMHADVEEIHKSALRASELTRQLLTFSRQSTIEPKVVDVSDLLSGMSKMLERLLGEDVQLVAIPGLGTGRVLIDPGGLEQVVMNLVVNARDAMPTGGKVTIETQNVVLDEVYASAHVGAHPGAHVMIAVSDTGVGMDKVTQARIFEPFFTTKPVGKGTGLGLSTAFGIVQQSGGTIWVYSEPGKGTTFKIYLPRVDASVTPVQHKDAPTNLDGSETILLVEDEEQIRNVVRSILARRGYDVIATQNAEEALRICEEHEAPIHMLLTDVVMPSMGGAELAKRLAPKRPQMKILCMSGYADDSIVRHGVLEAHFAFIQKPITPDALVRRVREVLGDPAADRKR